ncbi:MAG: D-alanyl-D-alanine carboxypeptidase [Clostridia bacterium]|nr:D-alanyl-D-alanine carboxypeptidase [Clostridia bacterium]
MKKMIVFCSFLLFLSVIVPVEAISVSAGYACLMDAQTGRVIYEKNAHARHSMASTTKIMTALLALENTKMDDIVTVSPGAAGTEGSSIYLAAGEKLSMEELLYGLMLQSGNDAAIAIAEHVGGSVEKFAEMMTARAEKIGAKNTAFQNPNGLDAPGHYTTAYDLALITREALSNPEFAEIVATKKKSYPAKDGKKARYFTNHNRLLSSYAGCIGVKTGYTKKTGRCLVSAATKDNATLICVTLNAPNDWQDHSNLLDYGFSQTETKPLVLCDMVLKSIPVKNGKSKTLELLAKDDFYFSDARQEGLGKIQLSYKLPKEIEAPVTYGTNIGKLFVYYDKTLLKEIDLYAGVDIPYQEPPKPGFLENFQKLFENLLHFV